MNRRKFLKSSAALLAVGAIPKSRPSNAYSLFPGSLRVGIIGCGHRGTNAAWYCAKADSAVSIVSMADVFPDHLETSLAYLRQELGQQVQVSKKTSFVGFDAYQGLLETNVDLVILASPQHFRPLHTEAAVAKRKHLFIEKPLGVDVPGVLRAKQALVEAKNNNLSVVSGLCYRYDHAHRQVIQQIQEGAVGEIVSLQSAYNRQNWIIAPSRPGWTEMEWQLRHWPNFVWLSGDAPLEILIHNLDTMSWVMGGKYPTSCTGIGGKEVSVAGDVFDHHSMVFEYETGVRLFAHCRTIDNCSRDYFNLVFGVSGKASVSEFSISGNKPWTFSGEERDMYRTQMEELVQSIRLGKPKYDGEILANATLMAIMGRNACYTGKPVTWQALLGSKEEFRPERYEFGPLPERKPAIPGKTPFL